MRVRLGIYSQTALHQIIMCRIAVQSSGIFIQIKLVTLQPPSSPSSIQVSLIKSIFSVQLTEVSGYFRNRITLNIAVTTNLYVCPSEVYIRLYVSFFWRNPRIVIQLWFFMARFMHKLFRIFQRVTISVHAHNLLYCLKIEMLLPGISCIPYNTFLLRVFLWQNARTFQLNSS